MDFILQLHITGKCNLRCKHCYIDEHSCDMCLDDIKKTVDQFEELVNYLEKTKCEKVNAHIHFTGGEPFLHPQIDKILHFFASKKDKFNLGIMSNGTVLKFRHIYLLKKMGLTAFQVSIDGDEEYHDKIRGKGNLKKVIKALDLLRFFGIKTRVSFTANKENYKLFPKVAGICRKHRVNTLWSDRYIPLNNSSEIKPIEKENMEEYCKILQCEKENMENIKKRLYVQNYRALQFLCSDDEPYFCKAADTFLTVDEHGNILPCRRMPIICGNINTSSLLDVYLHNDCFIELRKHILSGKCITCSHSARCKGGERCFTYALKNDYNLPDVCCWMEK